MMGTQLGWAQYGRHPTGMGPVWPAPNWDGPIMVGRHPTGMGPVWLAPNWEGPSKTVTQLGGSQYGQHPTGMGPV